jgi:hypothetical protein
LEATAKVAVLGVMGENLAMAKLAAIEQRWNQLFGYHHNR